MTDRLQSIRGMHDILPADIPVWQQLESRVRAVLESYGFEEIRVPMLEKTEVFSRAIGAATDVVEKEMYSFEDRNGDSLSLRPEGTAGVVRAALQNGLLYGQPQRLWYGGPMFRYERPQQGRTRQFHQIGAEVFGAAGPDVDAELLLMGERMWRALGLGDIRLELNSLGNAAERATYRKELSTYLNAHRAELDEETQHRLDRNPLRILDSKDKKVRALLENAPELPDFLGTESQQHFDGLCRLLDQQGVAYQLNSHLVRGLDYYCHTVFEWVTGELGAQGTICAGGRYDQLVEMQGGKPWPATGFAMGLERLVALMQLGSAMETNGPSVYFVLANEAAKLQGVALAEQLRNEWPGVGVICNSGSGSFKSQFKRADRSGAALAMVIGEDELARREVSVKFLREDRPQEAFPAEQLPQWFRAWQEQDNEVA